jgi:hypothetical protein
MIGGARELQADTGRESSAPKRSRLLHNVLIPFATLISSNANLNLSGPAWLERRKLQGNYQAKNPPLQGKKLGK